MAPPKFHDAVNGAYVDAEWGKGVVLYDGKSGKLFF
jgi:hypothetical protein